jgi:hypothetical protein
VHWGLLLTAFRRTTESLLSPAERKDARILAEETRLRDGGTVSTSEYRSWEHRLCRARARTDLGCQPDVERPYDEPDDPGIPQAFDRGGSVMVVVRWPTMVILPAAVNRALACGVAVGTASDVGSDLP